MDNQPITEAEVKVMQEVALNEIFGFFDSKARKFAIEKGNSRVTVTAAKSGQVYRNPTLFNGVIYTDKTRLPKQRWSLLRSKSPVPTRGSPITKGFNLIFILGYYLDVADLWFEVWYDSFDSTYMVLDKFATPVSSAYKNLDDAMAEFINLVSDENPSIHKSELSAREQAILKNLARRSSLDIKEAEDQANETVLVESLLEATKVTRGMLTDILNAQVAEYHSTRMNSTTIKHFWQFWGKHTELPGKYLSTGIWGTLRKIVGAEKTATFIVGFSLKNKIDIEIWFVKNNATGRGSFYVFDLTSAEIVAQDIKTIRQAYAAAGSKILVPSKLIDKIA